MGRQVQPPGYWLMAVDDRGRVANQPNGVKAFFAAQYYKQFSVQVLPLSFLHVSGLALTFLHSKNVEILPPPPLVKRRLPRNAEFKSRYHRLRVKAIGQRREKDVSEPAGISQSLHIVRGHFREYGPDYGKGLLFGKYSGRFWVAGHVSGSAEVGLITKDYEVIIPEENRKIL